MSDISQNASSANSHSTPVQETVPPATPQQVGGVSVPSAGLQNGSVPGSVPLGTVPSPQRSSLARYSIISLIMMMAVIGIIGTLFFSDKVKLDQENASGDSRIDSNSPVSEDMRAALKMKVDDGMSEKEALLFRIKQHMEVPVGSSELLEYPQEELIDGLR